MARIIVVDDDFSARATFMRMLRTLGHEVVGVESGRRAIEVIPHIQADVVLLDLNLSDMSGLDVILAVRQRLAVPRWIVVTGFGSINSAVGAMKLGAVDYLTKPVDCEQLADAVTTALAADEPIPTQAADGENRWAGAVATIVSATHDPRTLREWSQLQGAAVPTIRAWCRTAELQPKASLDLGRVLRALVLARREADDPARYLDVADHRMLERLLKIAGLSRRATLPSVDELLTRQRFITDKLALTELRRRLLRKCETCSLR